MRSLWQGFVKLVFWEFERGSLPYDILVIGVVVFVFASPRSWFNDQPQTGPVVHTQHVELLAGGEAATQVYRVDAHSLVAPVRNPQLEREAHDLLDKNVDALRGKSFTILRIEPNLGPDGSVRSYDVHVKR